MPVSLLRGNLIRWLSGMFFEEIKMRSGAVLLRRKVCHILGDAGITVGGSDPWDVQVHDERFFRQVAFGGLLGLGDAYVNGLWDCVALDQFFDRALRAGLLDWTRWAPSAVLDRAKHRLLDMQNPARARRNSGFHYDLSNTLFEYMLGQYMQYTCAYWLEDTRDLEVAQRIKLQMVCDKLDLRPGMRVLDMGCGWGGLAAFMVEHYDVQVVGINLSEAQINFARGRFGHSGDVTFEYCDYRDAAHWGKFDRVVAVGLGEHVGARHYRTWMKVIECCLKPDGLALLHMFGRHDTGVPLLDPWTRRYVFPGAELPTLEQLTRAARGRFRVADVHEFGSHYDPTLMGWHRNFIQNWDKISPSLDLQRFSYRGWSYYLLSAAGAFRAGVIPLRQIVLLGPKAKPYTSVRPGTRRQVPAAVEAHRVGV